MEERPLEIHTDNHSLDQVYSSFNRDNSIKTCNPTLHIKHPDKGANTESLPELRPPIRVTSPLYLGKSEIHGSNPSSSLSSLQIHHHHLNKDTQQDSLKLKRDSRSESPKLNIKGCNSKQSVSKVRSLELLFEKKDTKHSREKGNCDIVFVNGEHEINGTENEINNKLDNKTEKVPFDVGKCGKREMIFIDNFLTDEEIRKESLSADLY